MKGKSRSEIRPTAPCRSRFTKRIILFFAHGETVYGEPGSAPRSNAGWISLSPAQLTIPPQDAASVYYAIQAPEKPAFPGTYWSIVMVEPVPEMDPDSNQGDKDHLRIQTLIRYGIQIVTDIGTSAERRIKFLDKKFIYEGGQKFLQIDIENIGESWLFPSVWAEVYGKDGNSAGRFECGRARIYPGCSIRQLADLTKVPPGEYRVLVVVDNEDGFAVGAQYDLVVE